jgi:hypothetical protein
MIGVPVQSIIGEIAAPVICSFRSRMQGAYDTWNAERKEDVSKIPTLRANAA